MPRRDPQFRYRGATPPTADLRTPIVAEAPSVDVEAEPGVATMRLYDPIDSWGGPWGVSAKEFTAAIDALPDDTSEIRLHINSPGGEVFEAIAIVNSLRTHQARVVAIVDGIAASAASVIACSADELVMGRNSELMIHDASGICLGTASDMRKLGDLLDHLSDNIASVYAEKGGGTSDEWRAAMLEETWYSAEEAVSAGLADRVDGAAGDAPTNDVDLSAFKFAGRQAAPAPAARTAAPAERPESRFEVVVDADAVLAAVVAATDAIAAPAAAGPSIAERHRHRLNAQKLAR